MKIYDSLHSVGSWYIISENMVRYSLTFVLASQASLITRIHLGYIYKCLERLFTKQDLSVCVHGKKKKRGK